MQIHLTSHSTGRLLTQPPVRSIVICIVINKMKITVFVDHVDDNSDFLFMKSWLDKWEKSVHIENYSSGGWEHIWDIDAPEEAVKEIPKNWLCSSKWAGIG